MLTISIKPELIPTVNFLVDGKTMYVLRCEGSLASQVISVVRGTEIIRHRNVRNVGSLDWLLFKCPVLLKGCCALLSCTDTVQATHRNLNQACLSVRQTQSKVSY